MNKITFNLASSFLMGLIAFYILTQQITVAAIFVSLAATGIVALGYVWHHRFKKRSQ